jgi:hypothetical protein
MVAVAAESYQAGLGRGMKQTDAWNASTCDWITAAIVCIWAQYFDDLYLSTYSAGPLPLHSFEGIPRGHPEQCNDHTHQY